VFTDAEKTADYITTVMTVDNFLPVFDMNEEVMLDKKVEQQISKIKADILAKKHAQQEVTSEDRSIHETYLTAVSGAPETVWANFSVSDNCIGCGICTKVCPAGCIQLQQQLAVYTGENCQACYSCIHACPQLAIKLNIPEKNPQARYRNENVSLKEIVRANNQTDI
jgi:NAD-dependent dihydropyrimidine dehydrogenase PreA subunit